MINLCLLKLTFFLHTQKIPFRLSLQHHPICFSMFPTNLWKRKKNFRRSKKKVALGVIRLLTNLCAVVRGKSITPKKNQTLLWLSLKVAAVSVSIVHRHETCSVCANGKPRNGIGRSIFSHIKISLVRPYLPNGQFR